MGYVQDASYVNLATAYAALANGAQIYGTGNPGSGQVFGAAGPSGWIYYTFPTSTPTAAGVATSTGVNPTETAYSLYGHNVPLSVLGKARIGGEIIAGPWIANGLASFIISFGLPADPSGTRTLKEIAFDSQVVWNDVVGFATETFTYRFYGGTMTQGADSLETTNFGADAVAYRPQMLLAFENLPLINTKFGKIPYVSAVISDSTGDSVNWGEAFQRLAYSPWVGWTSSQFEAVGITDGVVNGGILITQQADFLTTIQQFGKFYPQWDILQTDKLRISDRGANVEADITLDKTRMAGPVVLSRQEPNASPRELELTTIDPDADYTLLPSTAIQPRVPVNVTTSVKKDTAFLPIIMDAPTRQAIVTYSLYHQDQARKTIAFTAMACGLEIEPGALVRINLGDDILDDVYRITSTLHGLNYTVECTAEALLRCSINLPDPYYSDVVFLAGFEGAPGSQVYREEKLGLPGIFVANAQLDASQVEFGTSSLRLRGTTDVVDWVDSPNWLLSSANSDQFTIEGFCRFESVSTFTRGIICHGNTIGSWSWGLQLTSGSTTNLTFDFSTDGSTITSTNTSGGTISLNQWFAFAVDKDSGGKIRVYIDGVMKGSSTPANSAFFNSTAHLQIGTSPGGGPMDGWIDEVRITKGLARYASDAGYAVTSDPFPRH